ncbi:DUF397 domain-containing protein [Amycolatopsis sp. NBC_00345]|uniref:DUF397 domain-containing protein n=1 Tax=Amycolatopsis sp. NBC_00345 TaxID=2975955 RepID=UPI002E25B6C2
MRLGYDKVEIRDSKNPDGPHHVVSLEIWREFVHFVQKSALHEAATDVASSDPKPDYVDTTNSVWLKGESACPDWLEYTFATSGKIEYAVLRRGLGENYLVFTLAEWSAFVEGARGGEFNVPRRLAAAM